jgi:mannose-6-phosphate isomerase-like protein (cupin superfamily)
VSGKPYRPVLLSPMSALKRITDSSRTSPCPKSADSRHRAIATAERTGGALSLVEAHGFKGTEPPIHYYEGADEFFHVVAGDMTFVVGR